MVLKKGLLGQTFVPWATRLFPPPNLLPAALVPYPPLGEKVEDEGGADTEPAPRKRRKGPLQRLTGVPKIPYH